MSPIGPVQPKEHKKAAGSQERERMWREKGLQKETHSKI